MEKVDTPELNRIIGVSENSQVIGEFLEWMNEKEISLMKSPEEKCRFCDDECVECGSVRMDYLTTKREQLLADFFEIDLAKAEKERQALLDAVKAENERK
jgi:hypothetical protein